MSAQDLKFISAFLKRVTFKDSLEWLEQTRDERISAVLKPLLFDRETGSVRVVSDLRLQGELLALATNDEAFRQFVAGKSTAELDRITAQYLEDQLGPM